MTTNFKNLFTKSNRAKKTQPRRSSLQPRFEALEDRRMMAAGYFGEFLPTADGKIVVAAVGSSGSDNITVNSYTLAQQITTRSGMRTIQVPMIEVKIMDAGGALRRDAAGTPLLRSYEQAKVSELRLFGDQGDDNLTNNSSIRSTMHGEGGNDTIYGGSGDDTIVGDGDAAYGAGQNKLYGRGGNDKLYGGKFNDELWGGIGDDDLHGGSGDDNLYGEDGKDELFGDGGNDNLFGGMHDDELWGGDDNDFLFGDGGDDLLVGESGSDHLYGGSDNDILMGGHRHFNVSVAVRNAENGESAPVWTQEDDGSADHLWGGDGQDEVFYNPNSDWVEGIYKFSVYSPDAIGSSGLVLRI